MPLQMQRIIFYIKIKNGITSTMNQHVSCIIKNSSNNNLTFVFTAKFKPSQIVNVFSLSLGSLSQWSAYGACSATCQSGLTVPTRQRTRNYVGATFGGNCNGSVLVQNLDCNVPMCQGNMLHCVQVMFLFYFKLKIY